MTPSPQDTHRPSAESTATASQQSLDQLAFRYIANELTNDELQAFEERLATDQQAREAVAAAVELSQAIAFVESTRQSPAPPVPASTQGILPVTPPLPADRRSWWPALGWMTVGSAACVAMILMADLWSRHEVGPNGTDRQLAMLWSETRGSAEWFIPGEIDSQSPARSGHVVMDDSGDSSRNELPSHREYNSPEASFDNSASDYSASDDSSANETTTSEIDDLSLAAGESLESDPSDAWGDPMNSPMVDTPSWMLAAVAETTAPNRSTQTNDRVPPKEKEER
ncbi:MAG: hypothetical protein U1A77_23860 [Pirellulales bacterium]